ncbi:MAG TPA: invasion associated locus B family protein [Croceibacterium sp.]|nr:invasion associated locus B family protein [Croceibacterium sp.]
MQTRVAFVILALIASPLAAKDSLGVFGQWGAFRDPQVPRCYAIAAADPDRRTARYRQHAPFASVGTWPKRGVRGQLHVRLSRTLASASAIALSVGGQRFALTGGGGDAWARDARMDAAIVAAMRSAEAMWVSARDSAGRRFTDRYDLDGAATAMDAATVGCARLR